MFYLCPLCAVLLFLLHILLSFPLITSVFFFSLSLYLFLSFKFYFILFVFWLIRFELISLDFLLLPKRGAEVIRPDDQFSQRFFLLFSSMLFLSLSLSFSFYFFVVSYLRACVSIYLKVETPPRLLLIALRHVHKRYIECIHTLRTLSGKLFFL